MRGESKTHLKLLIRLQASIFTTKINKDGREEIKSAITTNIAILFIGLYPRKS